MSNSAQLDQDARLNDFQQGLMQDMVDKGMDEREAKLRVLCIAAPPDHFMSVPAKPTSVVNGKTFPCMVYNADGRNRIAKDAESFEAAVKAGWKDKPLSVHAEKYQEGGIVTGDATYKLKVATKVA